MRGQGPGGVALTVVPGRPPVTQVRPPSCEVEKTLLLAPPPAKFRPDCDVVTIVCPKANESGSTCVLCCRADVRVRVLADRERKDAPGRDCRHEEQPESRRHGNRREASSPQPSLPHGLSILIPGVEMS